MSPRAGPMEEKKDKKYFKGVTRKWVEFQNMEEVIGKYCD